MEDNKEELNELVEAIEEEVKENKRESKGVHFIKVLLGGLIDQIVVLFADLAIFFVLGLMLKLFGFRIVSDQRETMFVICYLITNVLYYPLVAEALKGKTVGKKILFK